MSLNKYVKRLERSLRSAASKFLRPRMKNRVYTIRAGLSRGLRRKGGLGFLPRRLSVDERHLREL